MTYTIPPGSPRAVKAAAFGTPDAIDAELVTLFGSRFSRYRLVVRPVQLVAFA